MDTRKTAERFGGVAALAKAIGVSRCAVYQWGAQIPEPRASQVREAMRLKGLSIPTEQEEQEISLVAARIAELALAEASRIVRSRRESAEA